MLTLRQLTHVACLCALTITLSLSAAGTGRLATMCAADVGVFEGLAC